MDIPSLNMLTSALFGGVALIVIYFFRVHAKLSDIPGPFYAAFSNFPRLYWIWTKNAQEKHVALHRKYGNLVRMGPNMVSVGDPVEIGHIYGFDDTFLKSDFYAVVLPYNNGKIVHGIFGTQSKDIHKILERPVVSIYSMSNLVSFESSVDSTIRALSDVLDKRYAEKEDACDLAFWMQAFAFDTMGELTFSKPYGFIEQGKDVDGIMAEIWSQFRKAALVGQMPWIDTVFRINPLLSRFKTRVKSGPPLFKLALARMQEGESKMQNDTDTGKRDILSRFLAASKVPGTPPYAVFSWTANNITGGSDSTAIVLRAIFYYLLKNPSTLQTLKQELETAGKEGLLSKPPRWQETQSLRYLDACVKEGQRIHAPVGMHLERVVPKEGSVICGKFLEGGTIVGINAWVVHRDKRLFGDDADQWRPERWIDCTDKQRRKMEKALFTFGAGGRVCIGKNISLLMIYKLVPSLLQKFEISLIDPAAVWTTENKWFVPQKNINVRLKKLAT